MKDLHARQQISELLVRYATAIDRRDFHQLRSCFTADAVIDYYPIGVFEGVEPLVDFLKSHQADTGPRLTRITNADVSIGGDVADSRCYVDSVVMDPGGKGGGINPIGTFDDHLKLTEDGWRIARRKFTMVHLGRVGEPYASGAAAEVNES